MSTLLLDDLEEYELQPACLTPKKTVLTRIYGESLPTLITQAPDSIKTELSRQDPQKLWISHPTLPSLRSNKNVSLVKTERKRPKASFVMNYVLGKLKPPIYTNELPTEPSVGSYNLDKPLAYLMPKTKTTIITPEKKQPVREKKQERVIKPRRFVKKEKGLMWPEDMKYGEEEHNLRNELKTVRVNRRLVPLKESTDYYVNKHSHYKGIETNGRKEDLDQFQDEIEDKFDEMRQRLRNLTVSLRNCYIL